MSDWRTEITVFEKTGGPLTKRIALRDGAIVNDSSACLMADGFARRVAIDSMQVLADLINGFASNQAYALGRLKDGLPDCSRVVTADKLNGAGDPSVIARSKDYLVFKDGPGVTLLDSDFKGMSVDAKRRMEECGGLWGALCEVLPAFETIAYVERASTSSGLRNRETGETFVGSGGRHIVIPVLNAADILRFLSDLHARCWLAGLGWGIVSAAGSFLERSIVDKSVGSPERLIFEGAPDVVSPLVQDARHAIAHDGTILDTRLCPPLTDAEKAELQRLIDAEKLRLLPERERARAEWSVTHIQRLVARGMSEAEARKQVDRWIDQQELSGDFPLPFDDQKVAGATVEQVLATPDQYIEETLSDPFEGPGYGRGKAILYRRSNGSLFIKSYAHGGMTYELKGEKKKEPLLTSRAQFLKGFVAPDYLVDGILQRRFIYSLTGSTGGGKTAIGLLLTDAVGCEDVNATFGGHNVEKGKCVYFVGENPDDVRARIIGADAYRRDDPSADQVHFIVGIFDIEEIYERVVHEAEALGGVDLVIIDTSAAYFLGDEETNPQMGVHARMLRTLTRLPGGPCVLVLCHPIKYVTIPDQLLPRGGGAFLAEMDGNLTAWKHDEDLIELHHTGKLRGPGFEPITFRLDKITAPNLVDSKGRLIPTVRAVAVSEQEEAEHARDSRNDEDKLLLALLENADRSQRDLARASGFMLTNGEPYQSKVSRIAYTLKNARLVKPGRGGHWQLTDEGKATAKKLKEAEKEQRIEDRGGASSSKPFIAIKGDKCRPGVPCIHCHVADGNVYKIKDGRLRKGQGHYEALHERCAEDFYTGKPSPETPPVSAEPDLF